MTKKVLKSYAKLVAAVGANVQKDQEVIIHANVDQVEFVSLVVEECYKLGAKSVAVIVEAEHLCMTMRGIRAAGAETQTSAIRGTMRKDARTRAEVMTLLGLK